eukprot:3640946-Heterocapsa_arctica.AAC.1
MGDLPRRAENCRPVRHNCKQPFGASVSELTGEQTYCPTDLSGANQKGRREGTRERSATGPRHGSKLRPARGLNMGKRASQNGRPTTRAKKGERGG